MQNGGDRARPTEWNTPRAEMHKIPGEAGPSHRETEGLAFASEEERCQRVLELQKERAYLTEMEKSLDSIVNDLLPELENRVRAELGLRPLESALCKEPEFLQRVLKDCAPAYLDETKRLLGRKFSIGRFLRHLNTSADEVGKDRTAQFYAISLIRDELRKRYDIWPRP